MALVQPGLQRVVVEEGIMVAARHLSARGLGVRGMGTRRAQSAGALSTVAPCASARTGMGATRPSARSLPRSTLRQRLPKKQQSKWERAVGVEVAGVVARVKKVVVARLRLMRPCPRP